VSRRRTPAPPDPLVERVIEPPVTGFVHTPLALAWVAGQGVALWLGAWALAVLFAAVGTVAALQTMRAWERAGVWSVTVVVGAGPPLVVLGSLAGLQWAGMALFAVVVFAFVGSVVVPRRGGVLLGTGMTVRCVVAPAVVGVAVVGLDDLGWAPALMLLALAAGYDLGTHVWGGVGAGALAGRVVGVVTVLVGTLAFSAVHTVFELEPFGPTLTVWVFGGLAATLLPLGPIVASLLLPTADAPAPALRRLDSLIVAAPLWLVALWGYVG